MPRKKEVIYPRWQIRKQRGHWAVLFLRNPRVPAYEQCTTSTHEEARGMLIKTMHRMGIEF